MTATLTLEGQEDQVATWTGVKAGTMKVGLYTARSGSGKNVSLGNITPATFSGYTPVFANLVSGIEDANERMVYAGGPCTFTHNGGGTSNTITGWYMWDTGSGKLHYYEDYGAGVSMAVNGNFITINPKLYYGDLTPPL